LVLSGVQAQPDLCHPLLKRGPYLPGLLLGDAVNYRVIGVPLEFHRRKFTFEK